MAKSIRPGEAPICLAPFIVGYERNGMYFAQDHKINTSNPESIDLSDINGKILVYERSVKEWFLEPAKKLIRIDSKSTPIGIWVDGNYQILTNSPFIFITLMICISYYEGVQQYMEGKTSENKSCKTFCKSINRIYNNIFRESDLKRIYRDSRCGLFHSGMVKGDILANYDLEDAIQFTTERVYLNPKLMLTHIIRDFNDYIELLRDPINETTRENFDRMFTNLPNPL